MTEPVFLSTEEVSDRYRGRITGGTHQDWPAMRIGPPFLKIGKAVLYPLEGLEAWDQQNMVEARSSRMIGRARITDD